MPISLVDTSESGVHFGQSEQPSPEPVRLTMPPLSMIPPWAMSIAQAAMRIFFVTTSLLIRIGTTCVPQEFPPAPRARSTMIALMSMLP
jgi:hypothetical protein